MGTKPRQRSVDDIVQERLDRFAEKLINLFPDKEYELRKLINNISHSDLDNSTHAVEVLEDPPFDFINRQEGYVVSSEEMARIPGFIRGMCQQTEASLAIQAIAEKIRTDFTSRDDLTLQDITKVLEEQVKRLKTLDRVRMLAGIKTTSTSDIG